MRKLNILAIAALAAAACSDAPETVAPDPGADGRAKFVTGGGLDEFEESSPAIERLERHMKLAAGALAHVLEQASARRHLHEALEFSPHREKKVVLKDFVDGLPNDAVYGFGNVLSQEGVSWPALRDSLPELELYFPVPQHRAFWHPDHQEFFVATSLSETRPIFAFGIDGADTLLTWQQPPSVPVLAIVPLEAWPAETAGDEFDGSDEYHLAAEFDGQSPNVAMHVMKQLMIYGVDQYEGWMKGEPEIEVHVFVRKPGEEWAWFECAGENGWRYNFMFDQNSDLWTGIATIYDPAAGGVLEEYEYSISVWEDDHSTSCGEYNNLPVGEPYGNDDAVLEFARGALVAGSLTTLCWFESDKWVACAVATLATIALLGNALDTDDFIGFLAPSRNDCWERASGEIRWRLERESSLQGYAYVDIRDIARDPVCPSATISGPTVIDAPDSYTWSATNATGGDGSYSYDWYLSSTPPGWSQSGQGTSITAQFTSDDAFDYLGVDVVVTSGGFTTVETLVVTNSIGSCGSFTC